LSWGAIRSSKGESYQCCIRLAQHVPMVERASLETAKSFAPAPVRATVQPVQSIFPYSEAQASPALSNAVPSLHSLFLSQVVLLFATLFLLLLQSHDDYAIELLLV
jgi:hypothetical protein